jgi:hypothetical protein
MGMHYDLGDEEPSAEELAEAAHVFDVLAAVLTELGLVRSRKPLAAHNAAVDILMELEYRGISVSLIEQPRQNVEVEGGGPQPATPARLAVINGGRT